MDMQAVLVVWWDLPIDIQAVFVMWWDLPTDMQAVLMMWWDLPIDIQAVLMIIMVPSAHRYPGYFEDVVRSVHRYQDCFDDVVTYCHVSIHAVGGILAMLTLPFVGVLRVWLESCLAAMTVKFQHCWWWIWRRLDSVSTDGTVLCFAVFTMLAWVVRNWCWFLSCGIAAMLSVVLRYWRCCRVSCNIDDVGMRLAIMAVLSCVLR